MATNLSPYGAAPALAVAAALHRTAAERVDRSRVLVILARRRVAESKDVVAVSRHAVAASRRRLATPDIG